MSTSTREPDCWVLMETVGPHEARVTRAVAGSPVYRFFNTAHEAAQRRSNRWTSVEAVPVVIDTETLAATRAAVAEANPLPNLRKTENEG